MGMRTKSGLAAGILAAATLLWSATTTIAAEDFKGKQVKVMPFEEALQKGCITLVCSGEETSEQQYEGCGQQ